MKSKLFLALAVLATASFVYAHEETAPAEKPAAKAEKKDVDKDCCNDEECAKDAKADTTKKEEPKPAGAEVARADTAKK